MTNTKKEKILFCNICWMENYEGKKKGDIPKGGGAHTIKYEVCNFLDIEGQHYGYVRTQGDSADNKRELIPGNAPIALEKITARKEDRANKENKSISGVTVVWIATNPDIGGRYIVGWYNNATVYRYPKKIKSRIKLQKDNYISDYKILVSASDAIRLDPEKRKFCINKNRKFMGQSNIRYAYTDKIEVRPEDKSTISGVMRYIKSCNKKNKL